MKEDSGTSRPQLTHNAERNGKPILDLHVPHGVDNSQLGGVSELVLETKNDGNKHPPQKICPVVVRRRYGPKTDPALYPGPVACSGGVVVVDNQGKLDQPLERHEV